MTYMQDNRIILDLYVESMRAKLEVFKQRGLPDEDYQSCSEGLGEGWKRASIAMDECDSLEHLDPLFDLHSELTKTQADDVLFDATRLSVVEHVLDMEILEYHFSNDEELDSDRQMFFSCHCTDLFLISSLITATREAQKQKETRVLH